MHPLVLKDLVLGPPEVGPSPQENKIHQGEGERGCGLIAISSAVLPGGSVALRDSGLAPGATLPPPPGEEEEPTDHLGELHAGGEDISEPKGICCSRLSEGWPVELGPWLGRKEGCAWHLPQTEGSRGQKISTGHLGIHFSKAVPLHLEVIGA